MYTVFGMQFLTKEEQKEKEEAYLRLIFPGGEEEKAEVTERLRKEFPSFDQKMLLFFYIALLEKMRGEKMDFEKAYRTALRRMPFRMTEEEKARLLRLVSGVREETEK